MTLAEVMMALLVLALLIGGILATLLQSRRLTEGSVNQNSALAIVQGYMEQLKNMPLDTVINGTAQHDPQLANSFALPTVSATGGPDPLWTTPVGTPIPALTSLIPGTTPASSTPVDNLKSIPSQNVNPGTPVAWNPTAWPGARSYAHVSPANAGFNDLHLNIWVWITDLSGSSANATAVYGVTMIYTWKFWDGRRTQYIIGTIRSVRSQVPT